MRSISFFQIDLTVDLRVVFPGDNTVILCLNPDETVQFNLFTHTHFTLLLNLTLNLNKIVELMRDDQNLFNYKFLLRSKKDKTPHFVDLCCFG